MIDSGRRTTGLVFHEEILFPVDFLAHCGQRQSSDLDISECEGEQVIPHDLFWGHATFGSMGDSYLQGTFVYYLVDTLWTIVHSDPAS